MKKLAAVASLSFILIACNQTQKSGSSAPADTMVSPATDTSASSKLKNYTAPAQEDRLRKVSPDTTQKSK